MKNKYLLLSIVFTFSLVLAACTNGNTSNTEESNPNKPEINGDVDESQGNSDDPYNNDSDSETPVSFTAEEITEQMIGAIADEDMETLAQHVHPEQGLLFSPYVHVQDDAVVVDQEDVANLLASNDVLTWGLYDGKGTPIELTPAAYFEEFLDLSPFEEPTDILINDLQDRGNTTNNIDDKFPTATVIEYYNEGSEEYAGIDWSSILFVYEEDTNGDDKLIAIIRDMWTI